MDNIDNNIIIVSHSKRIRKLLYDNFENFNIKKKFKNCCILLLRFNNQRKITEIKLIYSGEIDKNENRNMDNYYDNESFNQLNIISTKLLVPENINIFLIRHAQGYHNYNNTFFRKVKELIEKKSLSDPQLTEIGKLQSINCGKFLNRFLNDNNIEKNKFIFFCSILLRTRETINNILDQIEQFKSSKDIYVLPCSQEISFVKGNEKNNITYGKCNDNINNRILYQCDYVFSKNNFNRNIIWKYYTEFKNENNNCNDTNMIYQTYIIYSKIINKDIIYIENLKKKLKI